jgi:hypothetical protein
MGRHTLQNTGFPNMFLAILNPILASLIIYLKYRTTVERDQPTTEILLLNSVINCFVE